MQDYFTDCIGQDNVKARLGFYLEGYWSSGDFPNVMFLAAKGCGKTKIARQTAKVLNAFCEKKHGTSKFYGEINCASVRSAEEFIPKFIRSLNNHTTFFFDEIHAMPSPVVDWLLTALEPEKVERKLAYGEWRGVLDSRRTTIIAATTERQKVFPPMLNRFQTVELAVYTLDEMAKIISFHIKTVKLSDETLAKLSHLCRGNARSAVDLAREVERYVSVKDAKTFDDADADELIKILDIFPLGLSRSEAMLLKIIQRRGACSLTALCAETGLTRAAQQAFESYLLRHALMEIQPDSKRVVTSSGRIYLDNCGLSDVAIVGSPLKMIIPE